MITLIHDLETSKGSYMMSVATKKLAEIHLASPLAFEAYHALEIDCLRALNYDEKEVNKKLVELNNQAAMIRLLPLIDKEFEVGKQTFTAGNLTDRLQYCYDVARLMDVKNPKEVKKAHLSDFKKEGWFRLKDERIETDGGRTRAYSIAEKLFELDQKVGTIDISISHNITKNPS